jgi:hypothetical protein
MPVSQNKVHEYTKGITNCNQRVIRSAPMIFSGNPRTSILPRDVPFISPKAKALQGVAIGDMKAQVEAMDTAIMSMRGGML